MFEYHGWINIKHTTQEVNFREQEECIREINQYIRSHPQLDELYAQLSHRNGMDFFRITGMHNHRKAYVFEVFREIGKIARGSYGILYIIDDEDDMRGSDYSNECRVWVLKRGTFSEFPDPFLSPVIPTIEDDFEGWVKEDLS